jgi:hypothetical protein
LRFRQAAPGGHAVLEAAVREKPEELSGLGRFDAIGMQIWPDVFALDFAFGIFAVAGGAVFRKDFGACGGRVRIAGKRIGSVTISCGNFVQPFAIAGFGEEDTGEGENQ